jgi:hypothetical protein
VIFLGRYWMLNRIWACGALALSCLAPLCCSASPTAGISWTNRTFSLPVEPTAPDTSVITGTASDPSGAEITHAIVHVQSASLQRDTETDDSGRFSLTLPPGTYEVSVSAPGFRMYNAKVTLGGRTVRASINARLAINTVAEDITVAASQEADTSAESNKSALIIKGDQFKDFSDDDSTFQKEIEALAGGSTVKPPQILVDGFSNGRFPPKNTIQEIRINRNPYSAVYDALGLGRVEIFTKPGTDKLHGNFTTSGNDDVFNSANPYTQVQPPYYTLNLDGNLSGPVNAKTSYFVSGTYNDLANNAIVNAINPTSLTPLAEAVPAPQRTQTYSVRVDRQVTRMNTLTARYEYNNVNVNNSGVGLLVLPSEGLNMSTTTQTLQLTDTQIIGAKMISQAHFQYIRSRQDQSPVSTGATVVVEGVFNGGGNPAQKVSDNTDHYEFQELFTVEHGSHFMRLGGRYRLIRDANFSTASYNGQFTFPSLIAYELAVGGETPAQIAASGYGTTQYNVTTGDPSATVLTGDLGVFAEDEWKIRKNFTLNYGLRIESQSAVPGHFDPAPRLGAAWAIRRKKVVRPVVTLRGGGGIFYDRFASTNILTAIRQQSGTRQPSYVIENPGFYEQFLNAPPPATSLGTVEPTLYNIDPHLRTESGIIAGVAAERSLGKIGTVAATYFWIRGNHQYLSRNINAPLPGTYNPADPSSGTRPLGGTQNIYQFDSGGIDKTQILDVNSQLRFGKWGTGFVLYNYQHARADVSNATTFPSNSYNLAQDYGRSAQPTQEVFAGLTLNLPLGISSNFFTSAQGGTPFNITTGSDLNGDTIYNDRPAFATNPNANSMIYKTRFGTFDANPQPGEKIIPINYGNSPNFNYLVVSLARSFQFGPRPASTPTVPAEASKGPPVRPDPPYTLGFSVEADNIFNHVNPGQPVGVLSSPLFGQSISLNSPLGLGGSSNGNRTVTLRCNFSF